MKKLLSALGIMFLSSVASAEYLVVTPKGSNVSLTSEQVCSLFLSQENKINGTEYKVYLPGDKTLIEGFYKDVCNKNISTVRRKWAQLVFSGRQKIKPPGKVEDLNAFLQEGNSNSLVFVSSVGDRASKVDVVFRQ